MAIIILAIIIVIVGAAITIAEYSTRMDIAVQNIQNKGETQMLETKTNENKASMKDLALNEIIQDIIVLAKANSNEEIKKALVEIAKDSLDYLEGIETK